MTDKKIKAILSVYVAIATVLLIACFAGMIHPFSLGCINSLTSIVLTGYWFRRYLLYPHRVELRELVFMGLELVCLAFALFFIFGKNQKTGLVMVQYLFSIVHCLAATGLLLFFILFKMKKLF